jgi:hypothetical protein
MKIDIAQLEYIHPMIRKIAVWVEKKTGLELTITSQYRIGTGSVHNAIPVRGHDFRMRHRGIGLEFEKLINSAWIYDPEQPDLCCAWLHGSGPRMHLHLQVHENTCAK